MKKFYIGLPCFDARKTIIERALKKDKHSLVPGQIDELSTKTKGNTDVCVCVCVCVWPCVCFTCVFTGYSGSDLSNLVKEAAFGPIRELSRMSATGLVDIDNVDSQNIEAITFEHYQAAMRPVRSLCSVRCFFNMAIFRCVQVVDGCNVDG